MKKLVVVSLLSLSASATYAQSIPAGTISLGGSIGYSNDNRETGSGNNTDEYSSSMFQFSPSGGYFVAENLAIGLSFGLVSGTRSQPNGSSTTEYKSTSLRVGPYVQYYKMLGDQFALTGTLGAGYQNEKNTSDDAGGYSEFEASGFYTGITPGIVFFPVPKLGLSASIGALGYSRMSENFDNAPDDFKSISSTFTADFGLSQLQFGGTFYFGR